MTITRRFDFPGAEGQRLSGRLDLPDGDIRAHAVFAHCFTCTKSSRAATRIARALTAAGIGVLRFDFTGLGDSEGEFADSTFSGSVSDLIAAVRAMDEAGMPPALLVGHSLGGAAALAAAGDLPDIKAVATIAAPADVSHVTHLLRDGLEALERDGEAEIEIGGRPFKIRRRFIEDLERHDQQQRIRDLRRPLLILHSPRDAVVAIDNATHIFLAARHPKSFVSLDPADHLLTREDDALYVAAVISAWASRYVTAPAPLRRESQRGETVVEETGEGAFQVEIMAGGARIIADEPPEVGGLGSGPTPYDLVSAGLGACTAMTLRMYARRKELPLDSVRVTVAHARDPAQKPPDQFSRAISLSGPLTDDQRARLLEIADRCPVHRTLSGGARFVTEFGEDPLAAESPIQHAVDVDRLALES